MWRCGRAQGALPRNDRMQLATALKMLLIAHETRRAFFDGSVPSIAHVATQPGRVSPGIGNIARLHRQKALFLRPAAAAC